MLHNYNCITVLIDPSFPLLRGISSLPLSLEVQQGECWNTVLEWAQSGGCGICWRPVPFIEQGHLMPTMKPLAHYPSACQDEAQTDARPNVPFILFRHTEVADWHVPVHGRQLTHTQTGRTLWSGLGDSWCLLILIVYWGLVLQPSHPECWVL